MGQSITHAQDDIDGATHVLAERQQIRIDGADGERLFERFEFLQQRIAGIHRDYGEARRASGRACNPKPAPKSTAVPPTFVGGCSASSSTALRDSAASISPTIHV
jgi:hypothetical protein